MNHYIEYASNSFTLPDICLRLKTVLEDPRASMDDIANLISVDPSLSAKLLRLANSALFRFASEINSISKAVSVIGGEALYNLVLAETANSAFKHFNSDLIQLDAYWHESIFTGIAAKFLAKELRVRGSDRFFVMGILQNLSEIVIAKANPDAYLEYINSTLKGSPWEKQTATFGFTFSACSGALMEHWQLPMNLSFPVKNSHNKLKLTSDLDATLLTCAARLAVVHFHGDQYNDMDIITPEMSSLLPLEYDVLQSAALIAQKETNKVVVSIL